MRRASRFFAATAPRPQARRAQRCGRILTRSCSDRVLTVEAAGGDALIVEGLGRRRGYPGDVAAKLIDAYAKTTSEIK
jgi:hypothetical protein